jgi:hypothetical protein
MIDISKMSAVSCPYTKEKCMSRNRLSSAKTSLPLDWWAVLLAIAAAFLIKVGVVPRIPW